MTVQVTGEVIMSEWKSDRLPHFLLNISHRDKDRGSPLKWWLWTPMGL